MVGPAEAASPCCSWLKRGSIPTLHRWLGVLCLRFVGLLQILLCRLGLGLILGNLVEVVPAAVPATSVPAAMPATSPVMHRTPAMDETPSVPAAPHSGEALAEEADMVGPAEAASPCCSWLKRGSIPTLHRWLGVLCLRFVGLLQILPCRLGPGLILGNLVEMVPAAVPTTSMPTAMPATSPVMHRAPAMDETPSVPAAPHSREALAEEADMVGVAEATSPCCSWLKRGSIPALHR